MSLGDQRRQAAKEWLLRVAADLFARQGVEATSMADIAEAADLSPPALYHYFANRKELISEATRFATENILQTIGAIEQSAGAPLERLRALATRHAEFVDGAGPGTVRFIYWSILDGVETTEEGERFAVGHRGSADFFRSLLDEAKTLGTIRSDIDIEVVTTLLIACFAGVDVEYAVGQPPTKPDQLYRSLVDVFTAYLTGKPLNP
jgi:AcrR family transcriptional regulator